MATFDEVGIRYLTAASVQAFRDNSALWCLRYLFGKSDFRSAAFARSVALNNGLKHILHTGDVSYGEDLALESYVRQCEEWGLDVMADPAARSEHDTLLEHLSGAVKAINENLGGFPRPIASGLATHAFIGEFNTPFLSVPSFIFEDVQLHVKYTHRCPSKIQPKDMMAMSVDAAARMQPPRVLYVTTKKHLWGVPTPADLALARYCLEEDALALQRFLGACETPEQALAMCPLNSEFYQWKPQLLSDARSILLNHTEKLNAALRSEVGGRLSEGPHRLPHRDLLSDYRPGDAEIDG